MNKIARILVRDIRRIDLIKIETTQSVFKIFAWNFGNRLQIAFPPYCGKPIFDLGPQKNLAAKFQNLPGKIQNLAAKFFLRPKSKIGSYNKVEMRFGVDSQNFMKKFWKLIELFQF